LRDIGRIDIFVKYAFVDAAEQCPADMVKSSDGQYKQRGKRSCSSWKNNLHSIDLIS
jgi:hypothetical protein